VAAASAPATLSAKSQPLQPIANGLMARSVRLLVSAKSTTRRAFKRWVMYMSQRLRFN